MKAAQPLLFLSLYALILVSFQANEAQARRTPSASKKRPSAPARINVQTPISVPEPSLPSFDHLEENTLFFKIPKDKGEPILQAVKTNLFDLSYIGVLNPFSDGLPYFLFSAKPCKDCSDDKAIYFVRPSGNEKPTAFVYPGKILEPKSRAVLLESRAFYGKCLPRKKDVFIVFQREKVDRKKHLLSSVIVAEPAKDHLEEKMIEKNLPQIRTTLQLVKKKSCYEIETRNRLMSNKQLNIHPRSSNSSPDDDEDDNSAIAPLPSTDLKETASYSFPSHLALSILKNASQMP